MKGRLMSQGRILIVEDDFAAAEVLQAYLERDGFLISLVSNGRQALEQHARWRPDLVLLDIMLPVLSGNEVLNAIRQHAATPVIMVTAVGHETNRINSLLFGADDYVVKPYNPGEVVARVFAVLRRCRGGGLGQSRVLQYGNLTADLDAALASIDIGGIRHPLDLTRAEFNLLAGMLASPTRMFTRSELLASCLPGSDAMDRVVDAHLHNLRRKLNRAGISNVLLSVRGLGYRFCNPI